MSFFKKGEKIKVQSLNDKTVFFETVVLKDSFFYIDGIEHVQVHGVESPVNINRVFKISKGE